jgi:vacuolar-type H+-ATPase catalytic subunit A/Vma1
MSEGNVLGELGLAEEGLPEYLDIVLERYYTAAGDVP